MGLFIYYKVIRKNDGFFLDEDTLLSYIEEIENYYSPLSGAYELVNAAIYLDWVISGHPSHVFFSGVNHNVKHSLSKWLRYIRPVVDNSQEWEDLDVGYYSLDRHTDRKAFELFKFRCQMAIKILWKED